ncbi:MAG: PEP-CTERM sorting domain-containing protein, partial [Bryobacteraceae bacterium]
VNASTGGAHLIGTTHLPVIPFIPGTPNADGTVNIFNETLFSAGGKLYATLDADILDRSVPVITPVVNAGLYEIDPNSGVATLVNPTELIIISALDINGTVYGFAGNAEAQSHSLILDVASGNTKFITNVDPAAGLIFGATPVPEPASLLLAAFGIAAITFWKLRRASHAS